MSRCRSYHPRAVLKPLRAFGEHYTARPTFDSLTSARRIGELRLDVIAVLCTSRTLPDSEGRSANPTLDVKTSRTLGGDVAIDL
jgi:hypothetical protein